MAQLMLETLQVARQRRLRAGLAALRGAVAAFVEAMRPLQDAFRHAAWQLERLLRGYRKPGYYWRGGKLRRDHGYFRRRARARRAYAKAVRASSR